MALYSVTLAKLKKSAEHVCASKLDLNFKTYDELVNEALSKFVALRDWTWKVRQATLSTVAAQSYIALPADFGRLVGSPQLVGNFGYSAMPVTLEQLKTFRASSASNFGAFTFYYAIAPVAQTSVTALPTWQVELWPTPTATTADAFTYVYERVIASLSASTDVPDIPAELHTLLELFVRKHAAEFMRTDKETEKVALNLAKQFERDLASFVGQDIPQMNLGRLGSGRGRDVVLVAPTVTGA